jgi:hypothetical protein
MAVNGRTVHGILSCAIVLMTGVCDRFAIAWEEGRRRSVAHTRVNHVFTSDVQLALTAVPFSHSLLPLLPRVRLNSMLRESCLP